MCQDCGCGLPATGRASGHAHPGSGPSHAGHAALPGHQHSPTGPLAPGPSPGQDSRWLEVRDSLLAHNDRLAARNRALFRSRGLLVLNILGSPGAGKTTLISRTGRLLGPRLRLGAIVGDLATDHDARRIREAGTPVVQVSTGTLCHLEASMVAHAAESLDLAAMEVLAIENVGNLVCPAGYDLGEAIRVVLLSVTEGEDKPLKYPPLFHSADVVLITKTDLAEVIGFDRDTALRNLQEVSHHARILEVSARTGQGMEAWGSLLTGLCSRGGS